MKINLKKSKAFKAKFSVKNVLQQPGNGAFACISTQTIIPIQTQLLKRRYLQGILNLLPRF